MAKNCKITVYFTPEEHEELERASEAQQRSVSWLVYRGWHLSRNAVLGYPAVTDTAAIN